MPAPLLDAMCTFLTALPGKMKWYSSKVITIYQRKDGAALHPINLLPFICMVKICYHTDFYVSNKIKLLYPGR